nr:type IV pilin protein [Neisseria meningitidis]
MHFKCESAVVLILSVLALIVYPSYRNYVEKAKINAVRAALLENAHFMEKFYLQNGRFKQTSTKWPSLPIKEAEGFCIRLNGIARGALDSKFMLKAVAIDKDKNPFIIKMNENLVTFICKKSASSCSDGLDYFKGNDKDCKLLK